MERILSKSVEIIKEQLREPLFENSFFLMLTSVIISFTGFVFWIIAAKLYAISDMGVAIALQSSVYLLALFSSCGLDYSMIRFFPERDKNMVISTSIIITTFLVAFLGLIFIIGINWGFWYPGLVAIKYENSALYILYLMASSFSTMATIPFIAMRKSKLYFIISLVLGLRIILLYPLSFQGSMGVFNANGISMLIAIIVELVFLERLGMKLTYKIDKAYLFETYSYSFANYISNVFLTAPNFVLPLLVLDILGSDKTSQYSIAFSISSVLSIVTVGISTSLLVEGSYNKRHNRSLKRNIIKSATAIFIILIPMVWIIYFYGDYLLELIGKEYCQSFELLRILILSSLFFPIIYMYITIKRIGKDTKSILIMSSTFFAILTVASYIFLYEFGLMGIGYAWNISYGFSITLIIISIIRKNFLCIIPG